MEGKKSVAGSHTTRQAMNDSLEKLCRGETLSENVLMEVCSKCRELLSLEPNVVTVDVPLTVVTGKWFEYDAAIFIGTISWGDIIIYDPVSDELLSRFIPPSQEDVLRCTALSVNSKYLVSVGSSFKPERILLWDLKKRTVLKRLNLSSGGHPEDPCSNYNRRKRHRIREIGGIMANSDYLILLCNYGDSLAIFELSTLKIIRYVDIGLKVPYWDSGFNHMMGVYGNYLVPVNDAQSETFIFNFANLTSLDDSAVTQLKGTGELNELMDSDQNARSTLLKSRSLASGTVEFPKCQIDPQSEKQNFFGDNYTDRGYGFDKRNARSVVLNDQYTVQLKPPQYKKILDGTIKDANSITDTVYGTVLMSLDKLITEEEQIDFNDETEEEIKGFIESLNNEQFTKIMDYVNSLPTVSHDVDFKCENCGKENKVTMRGLQDFF